MVKLRHPDDLPGDFFEPEPEILVEKKPKSYFRQITVALRQYLMLGYVTLTGKGKWRK